MPPKPSQPTDPAYEQSLGRVALWLDIDDLRWLARHCTCTDQTPEVERERCARLRFRASAALHKAGYAVDAATDATDEVEL